MQMKKKVERKNLERRSWIGNNWNVTLLHLLKADDFNTLKPLIIDTIYKNNVLDNLTQMNENWKTFLIVFFIHPTEFSLYVNGFKVRSQEDFIMTQYLN